MSAPRSHEEADRIGFGESGQFDSDIFASGSKNRFEGYNDSIAVNDDDLDDDDDDNLPPTGRSRPNFSAPSHILRDIPQADKDIDPFAEHRRPTIVDRQRHNEYLSRASKLIISPERADPFIDGQIIDLQPCVDNSCPRGSLMDLAPTYVTCVSCLNSYSPIFSIEYLADCNYCTSGDSFGI